MVQPKTPPLSVRIPPGILAVVDAIAAAEGKTRHETILNMLSVATVVYVRDKGVPLAATVTDRKVEPGETVTIDSHRITNVSDAAVFVPLISRPKFNPQPKPRKK